MDSMLWDRKEERQWAQLVGWLGKTVGVRLDVFRVQRYCEVYKYLSKLIQLIRIILETFYTLIINHSRCSVNTSGNCLFMLTPYTFLRGWWSYLTFPLSNKTNPTNISTSDNEIQRSPSTHIFSWPCGFGLLNVWNIFCLLSVINPCPYCSSFYAQGS